MFRRSKLVSIYWGIVLRAINKGYTCLVEKMLEPNFYFHIKNPSASASYSSRPGSIYKVK